MGHGQVLQPLDLAKLLFGRDSVPGMEAYIGGEYEGRPNGSAIRADVSREFLLLGQTADKAVVALTLLDSLGEGVDSYLHFSKDTAWRMTAFRGLAMTGILEEVKMQMEQMTPEQVDSAIKASKDHGSDGMFTSKEEFDFTLGNIRLTIALDQDIIKHFTDHREGFERIKDAAIKELGGAIEYSERGERLVVGMEPEYKALYISHVSRGGYELGNCVRFEIGGMVDNSVGYLFVQNEADLPIADPDRIIMLRSIGRGWYLFKTT